MSFSHWIKCNRQVFHPCWALFCHFTLQSFIQDTILCSFHSQRINFIVPLEFNMNFIHKTTKFMHTKAIVRFTSTWPDKHLSQTRLLYLRIIIWVYSYELIFFNYFIGWVIAADLYYLVDWHLNIYIISH